MPSAARDGMRIAYEVDGDAEGAVVLAHNMFADRTIYRGVIPSLRSRRRTIAIDLRGHGESRGVTGPFATRDLAGDLAAVMDAAGSRRAVVVGVSVGACAAMELALAEPDRVEGLVLLGATPYAAIATDRATNLLLAMAARFVGLRPFATASLGTLFGATFRSENPDAMRAWGKRIGALAPRDAYHAIRAWTARPALLSRLSAIRVPTLVAVGEEDTPCPPPYAEAIRAAIRGARIERVARAGHTAPFERPAEVAALIAAFLDDLDRATK